MNFDQFTYPKMFGSQSQLLLDFQGSRRFICAFEVHALVHGSARTLSRSLATEVGETGPGTCCLWGGEFGSIGHRETMIRVLS